MTVSRIVRRAGEWLAALGIVLPAALAQNAPASASSGATVYQRYCVTCHGLRGDGTGEAARLHKPPPSDLTRSTKSDTYKALIIRVGGAPMGRSTGMPPWGQELSDSQIHDVVAYLRGMKAE